jgi:hypothetical protein
VGAAAALAAGVDGAESPPRDEPGELAPKPPIAGRDRRGRAAAPGAQVHVPTEQVAQRGRRRVAVIVALLLAALLAVVAVVLRPWAGGDRATVAARADRRRGGRLDAAVAIDAGAPALLTDDAAPDAGRQRAGRRGPAPGARRAARRRSHRAAAAGRRRRPAPAATAAGRRRACHRAVDDGAGLSLKALYARVATELDQAMRRVGADATAALRRASTRCRRTPRRCASPSCATRPSASCARCCATSPSCAEPSRRRAQREREAIAIAAGGQRSRLAVAGVVGDHRDLPRPRAPAEEDEHVGRVVRGSRRW